MILKKSFLGSMIQNLKRRRAIIVFVFMALFFCYPVNFLLRLQAEVSEHRTDAENLEACMEAARNMLSYNTFLFCLFGFIGMVIGVQAFGFLHKKNKMDFYNSVPVSYNRRFLVILLNSILILIVPVLICYFLCLSVFGAYGILNSGTAEILLITMFTGVLVSLGVFSVASLSVCLTGRTLTAELGTVVLLIYELGIYGLINIYMERSFTTYIAYFNRWSQPKFSLIYYALEIINARVSIAYNGNKLKLIPTSSSEIYPGIGTNIGFCIFMMFIITIVTLFLAYICFKKRPAEAAGRSMAFDKTKRVIKYMIVIPGALYGAELFKGMWEDDFFTFVIGLVITIVMGNMLIEVIYEADIRSAVKHLVDIPVTMAVAVLWIGVFSNDVFGYDSYIPNQDSVKAVAFEEAFDRHYNIAIYSDFEDGIFGNYYSIKNSFNFWLEHPFEDEKIKEVILNKAKKYITNENGRFVTVGYYLKNGQKKYRQYRIPENEVEEIMDTILYSESYKEMSYNRIYETSGYVRRIAVVDESGNRTEVAKKDVDEVLDAYMKDMENRSIKDIEENVPAGTVWLSIPFQDGNTETLIYPFCRDFENTVSCLEKKGLWYSDYLKERSIESVYVYNFKMNEDGFFMHNDIPTGDELYEDQSVDMHRSVYGHYSPIYNRKWVIPTEQSDAIREIAETGKSQFAIGYNAYDRLKSAEFNGAASCYAVEIKWKSASGEDNTDIFYFEEDSVKEIEDIIRLYGKEE